MAFDGPRPNKTSGIYAEIREPFNKSLDLIPDATLNLTLRTPSLSVDDGYKGSSESGLYSVPNDSSIQYVPDSPYATVRSANNYDTISPYETAPEHTRRPHTPPQAAAPLTAEEIDAMYAKPNKNRIIRKQAGRPPPYNLPESGQMVNNNLYVPLSELGITDGRDLSQSRAMETDMGATSQLNLILRQSQTMETDL